MQESYNYNGIEFDDWVDGEYNVWSQICEECRSRYSISNDMIDWENGGGICGIKNCENEADYYIDFR